MSHTIMTMSQAFNVALNQFPYLYAHPNIERSKLRVYDQIFNVIGNGYVDQDDFDADFTITAKNKPLLDNYPAKYSSDEILFEGYTEIDPDFEEFEKQFPKSGTNIKGLYTEWEKDLHPEVKLWREKKPSTSDWIPYPNFQKEYSLVWDFDMDKLDASWLEEAVWFYEQSKKFFLSEASAQYHYAWPSEPQKQQYIITSFESRFPTYNKEGMTQDEYYAAISKAYEFPYNGDTQLFVQQRWEKEKARILAFIEETTTMLSDKLEARITTSPGM